jgi:hypothetical protein
MRDSSWHRRWLTFAWRRPEWWAIAIAIVAWCAIVAASLSAGPQAHVHDSTGVPSMFAGWMLMVAAMMLPLVVSQVRGTAFRSLWHRRHRAIGGFLLGYVVPWLALGLVVSAGLWRWPGAASPPVAALGFLVAIAWLRTPIRRHALRACHREMPLAPAGWRADQDCLRYGWMVGVWCGVACWPAMLACAFAQHSLTATAAAAVLTAIDRTEA